MNEPSPRQKWIRKIQLHSDERFAQSGFQEDAESLKRKPSIIQWVELQKKYGFHRSAHGYVLEYVKSGNKLPQRIAPPVILISDFDGTLEPSESPKRLYQMAKNRGPFFKGLYLEIEPGSTIADIDNFIRDNRDLLSEKLSLLNNGTKQPIRQRYNTERDERIYRLVALENNPVKVVADQMNLSPQYVTKIVARQRVRHQRT
jgi:hypothetical protein